MGRHIITLTTDFGTDSPYVAQMKGVICSINPRATIIDITHAISPQNVLAAALVLDEVCHRFPQDSIHVAVVDPGVGTRRALVAARVRERYYLLPDNGLLSHVVQREWPSQVIRLEAHQYWLGSVSATFHGRDILAPVAARLSLGLDPRDLGPPHRQLALLQVPVPTVFEQRLVGEVISTDSFGNLITNITAELLPSDWVGRRCAVCCGAAVVDGLQRTYRGGPLGATVALFGSSGRLEIAVVQGNAAIRLAAHPGDKVEVSW